MNWFNFFIYMVSMAFTPGPNNLASMANMARKGFKRGIIFNIGILASQFILMAVCVVLCTTISSVIPSIQLPLKILGCVYIVYLAIKTFISKGPDGESSTDGTFLSGFLLNSLNVKYILFCIVTLQTYLITNTVGKPFEEYLGALVAVIIAFCCHVTWGLLGYAIRDFYKKHVKLLNTIFSILLIYCAVSILIF